MIGLYTGTRSAAICGAAYMPTVGRSYLDLERGVFHRRAQGAKETKKRQPPVRLPPRLLAHLRQWKHLVEQDKSRHIAPASPVEWNGKQITKVRKGFAAAAVAAGLAVAGPDKVTPATSNGADSSALMWPRRLPRWAYATWSAAGKSS